MRWWPWTERRSQDGDPGDYTAQELDRFEREVTGDTGNAEALAAVEAGVGMIERAFASVTVTPAIPSLTPSFLGLIGRAACLHGEHLSLVSFGNGRLELLPSYASDVRGGVSPSEWLYWLSLPHPSGTQTTYARADSVAHFRWNCAASQPWRGRSPLRLAKLTAATATAAERSMADDLAIPAHRQIRIASQGGTSSSQGKELTASVNTGRGRVRSTGGGAISSIEKFGPDAPAGVVTTRTAAAVEVAGALGIPVALLDPGAVGQAQRESYRRLILLTVNPMLAVVQSELREKLAMPDLRLDTGDLAATDAVGRARVVKNLVDAGLPLDQAVAAAGMMAVGE